MLSTDCDCWTTLYASWLTWFYETTRHMKHELIFMMLNYKNGPPMLSKHFYIMNIVNAIEYNPYCPHIRMPWWKRCSKCMLWCAISELPHQQIFDRGDHFHLLQRRAARLATAVGPWGTVSDYCILQHRHRGCCPLVGGRRPKRSKLVSELPRFTLYVYYINVFSI